MAQRRPPPGRGGPAPSWRGGPAHTWVGGPAPSWGGRPRPHLGGAGPAFSWGGRPRPLMGGGPPPQGGVGPALAWGWEEANPPGWSSCAPSRGMGAGPRLRLCGWPAPPQLEDTVSFLRRLSAPKGGRGGPPPAGLIKRLNA